MTKAQEIAAALTARLATITTTNGYATDIGTTIFRGNLKQDEYQIPCIVVVEGEESVEGREGRLPLYKLTPVYNIEGYANCDPNQPNDMAHAIVGDLKRCLFGGDITYGGTVYRLSYRGRTIGVRPDGLSFIGGSIEISTTYTENLAES